MGWASSLARVSSGGVGRTTLGPTSKRARERRLREHQAKRYGPTERTGDALRVVQYDDPSAPLESVTDYRSPLFDSETRTWLAFHAGLCRA